ncbi:hypothetical protein FY133_09050 [Agrobacterium tumefaciens]|jgi:hypothetical protein|uniref:Uncharacterized protein n=1 Tax=Agrobacterium tumefaciens str. Kerr 14 TaxID=1183424 RepID=A0A1S7NV81_AGRTU|nr:MULTISPECIES: DUF6220 domain-containing protein [Agrobacterium]AYM81691.1 hypothetical protein At12D1_18040 [Agrobacterium tumefaciens]NTE92370.1 hypothetical protein [Agrobacterium tumefaciens]QAA98041.1 hypothetical protein DC439_10320 [Agrobacterium tumefaciens]UXS09743.1 hypothetical protein FY155_09090 [Agrobacterium tumefaciens]UXS17102.1 hypothetical protein FY154_09085 [Agrobacterium tumefaciens]
MATVANGVSARRRLFVVISASVPVLIFAQVLLAGLSLYYDGSLLSLHKGLGFLIAVPILSLMVLALRYDELRPNLARALVLLGLYCLQVALMSIGRETGNGFLQALHVPNAFVMGAFSDFAARQARSLR